MRTKSYLKTKRQQTATELFVADCQSAFDIDLQRELRVGNVVLIKDYLPRNVNEKFYNQMLVPKHLDRYWMYYLNFKGFQECVPVPLTKAIIESIPEFDLGIYGMNLLGTNFFVEEDGDGNFDLSVLEVKIARIKYLHQLQNVFFDLTGAELTITDALIKFLLKAYKNFTCSASKGKPRI